MNWMETAFALAVVLTAALLLFLVVLRQHRRKMDESLLPGNRGSGGEQPEHLARSPPGAQRLGSSSASLDAQARGAWSCVNTERGCRCEMKTAAWNNKTG